MQIKKVMKKLEGNNFILRSWSTADVASLAKYANNEKIAMNLRDGFPHPYTEQDARSWISMVLKNKKDLIYAVEVDGEAAGGIGLHGKEDVYRYNAEIGYWLAEKHWGRGIITEAVALLVDQGFSHYSWTRIYAGIFSNNIASMKVLQKCGFKPEAILKHSVKKRGAYLDEHIYALLKEDWKKTGSR